jgi:Flp pilus assembly protein TadG
MPLLVLLLFGMVDAGWAFSQNLEVRHGAREGARLAAVDFDNATNMIDETCSRMGAVGNPDVTVAFNLPGTSAVGETASVTVTRAHSSLTGFLPFFDNINLTSTVQIRLEQVANWGPLTEDCT